MSQLPDLTLPLTSEEETARLAAWFARTLHAGDTVLLSGAIGAGKTHFCRNFIQTRLGALEDVPSPTFTLVQTYTADVEIWHADLYRLTHPDEANELGLEDAFHDAICLIEWPERLGHQTPADAICIDLTTAGEGRLAKIRLGKRRDLLEGLSTEFSSLMRVQACNHMLERSGWGAAERQSLPGDASARRYERLILNGQSRMLMDSPPGMADSVADFARIDRHLLRIGLSAPKIYAEDIQHGYLLTEDFGNDVFATMMDSRPEVEGSLYLAATDVLLKLQGNPPPPGMQDLAAGEWADAAAMVLDWYRFAISGQKTPKADFVETLTELISIHADGPRVMILRDYHAENLMWLPERQGVQRVGLLDFQLAQLGQPSYDLVSMLQDARRDLKPGLEAANIRHFVQGAGVFEADFLTSYAVIGAQRSLRILGIFSRLCLVSSKPKYIDLIPRVWEHLQRNLAIPQLAKLRALCDLLLPAPTSSNLERLRSQCGSFQ